MLVAVVGAIGGGKTTLAKNLETRCGFARISADEVRLEMTGSLASWNPAVWSEVMQRCFDLADNGRDVVMDCTGSASRFPSLIAALEPSLIVRLECDWRTWQAREGTRGREGVHYPRWKHSLKGARLTYADLVLRTDDITTEQVFDEVAELIADARVS